MPKKIDLKNQRYGRLIVLHKAKTMTKRIKWLCLCDCGNKKVIQANHLRSGDIVSCGCYNKEVILKRCKTHGGSKDYEYHSYISMMSRCYNQKNVHYSYYGGRGIFVSKRWRDSYLNFKNDMGERPLGYTIERIDNELGYNKANCKWATRAEQRRNTRATKLSFEDVVEIKTMLEILGKIEIAQIFDVSVSTIRDISSSRTWADVN